VADLKRWAKKNRERIQHRKQILKRLPGAVLRPQASSDWTGDYPLPSAVAEYYAELGPVDVSIEG